MVSNFKKVLFKTLSLENYLRVLQRSYFLMYHTGLLKSNDEYAYHYFVKSLIKPGDTILDIGANLGYYSMLFAKWTGPSGKVYGVEPIPVYNKIYREAARKFNNITLYPYALGTEEKTIDMVSSPGKGYLSTGLLHVHDAAKDKKRVEEEEFSFKATMKIPSKLFSDIKKIDYIKCDIEGFEYIVLSNMRDLIDQHKPKLQVEVNSDNEDGINRLFKELNYIKYTLVDQKLVALKNFEIAGGDYIFLHQDLKI